MDRAYKHLFHNGSLEIGPMTDRYFELRNQLNPMCRHLQGTDVSTSGFNKYMPCRKAGFLNLLVTYGLWQTTVIAPEYTQHGGLVADGTVVGLVDQNTAGSTLYYAIHGKDPRAFMDVVSADAISYTTGITIDQPMVVAARARGSVWSPLNQVTFTIAQDWSMLRVTEIMYDAVDDEATGASSEFIELKNVGNTTLKLNGVHFSEGIAFTFGPDTSIAPGAFVCVVKSLTQFRKRYAVCSVQCAVCSVQCAVCSVQCAVCSVQCAVCSAQRLSVVQVWQRMPERVPVLVGKARQHW